ncbi:MAG TPA: HTH domain-containing protein [Candidatus Nanoarchaeia archaeon]|nr:HTH domain-containing protein [Candidatus Nanoarchaeia archaeon]
MEIQDIAKQLKGLQTVSSIARKLNVSRRTAINYAWKLRKEGYLANLYGGKVKIYRVSPLIRKKKGYSFYELLNKQSKVKLNVSEEYIIHSKQEPSIEELLARAVSTRNFRVVLASLGLFNKVKDWSRLKLFAGKYAIERKIGALYDLARETIKVRRMDERTRQGLLKGSGKGFIINNLRTKDFTNLEKRWQVYIPFNKADLEVYKA